MTEHLTDEQLAAAARKAAVSMVGGLAPGLTGLNIAAEIAEKVTAPYAAEITRLRAALAEYTHPVATCSNCHHLAPWHVGSLGKTERPCTQHACGCTDLATAPAAAPCACTTEPVHQHGCPRF
ncbi:hypothetical protein [Streptacidiphilus carbonis]|uniref:hypothetical protein n=1 Tax=Streptacidiphilus carbonis TaxID=105422 RepID=UPI0005A7BD4B|nr:hypothetical protein [Streptacidiphilus carbonis]